MSYIDIDQTKLNRMLSRIISIERENQRTKEHSDIKMKDFIKNIIEEELKCN